MTILNVSKQYAQAIVSDYQCNYIEALGLVAQSNSVVTIKPHAEKLYFFVYDYPTMIFNPSLSAIEVQKEIENLEILTSRSKYKPARTSMIARLLDYSFSIIDEVLGEINTLKTTLQTVEAKDNELQNSICKLHKKQMDIVAEILVQEQERSRLLADRTNILEQLKEVYGVSK